MTMRTRWASLAAVAVTASAMVLSWGSVPAGAAPTATPAQKAEAIAAPSVVFIQTDWSGYLMEQSARTDG